MLKKLFAYRTSQASSIQDALNDGSAVHLGDWETNDLTVTIIKKTAIDIADSVDGDEELAFAFLHPTLKITGSHGHLIIDSISGNVLSREIDDDPDEYYSGIARFHMDRFWQLQRDLEIDWSDRDEFDICIFGYWNLDTSYDEPAPDYTKDGFMALVWTGQAEDAIEAMDILAERQESEKDNYFVMIQTQWGEQELYQRLLIIRRPAESTFDLHRRAVESVCYDDKPRWNGATCWDLGESITHVMRCCKPVPDAESKVLGKYLTCLR